METPLSVKIRAHLQKFRPKMWAELVRTGQAEAFVQAERTRGIEMLETLMDQGYQHHQALETVYQEVLPPSEEEMPHLGETTGSPTST